MRVLVVEDYAPLRKAVVRGLREAGFAVDAAGDGRDGMAFALLKAYDAIVLDLMLPEMDGLDVLRELRRRGLGTPVLILTARHAVDDRVRGLDAGADDYLVKPFAFEELLARVRALVRRGYGVKGPVISVGDLSVDAAGRAVRWAGEEIPLTAREYAILHYLAVRAGQVVSRDELWEHVYASADETVSNVLDVYVSRLRRKLKAAGAPPLIRTRRGMGYVLEER